MVWLAVALATAIAAGLRLPFLGHQSLWLDEIYTREIIRESSLSGLWHHIETTESTPPLYYALGWLLHARSTVGMRLISASALIASIPIAYLALRRLIGWRAALATAVILAVSPMLVFYSTDARSYGLFVLIALLSIWAFSTLLEQSSRRSFVLWVLASVACVWTHYFGIFVVAAEVAVLLVVRPSLRRATVGFGALVCVCILPLIPLVVGQSGDERAGFIAGIPLRTRLSEAIRQFAMGPNVPRAWLEVCGLVVFGLAVTGGVWMALRARRLRPLLVLAVAIVLLPLLLAAAGIEDRFYARNIIAALPLVVAVGVPAMLRFRAAPLAIYVALAAVVSIWVATDWRYEQPDWKSALARAESIDSNAVVLAVTRLSAPVVQTYLGRPSVTPSGVVAQRAWVIVEPVRAAGQRALGAAPAPSVPGFFVERAVQIRGFTLVLLAASRPTEITPTAVPGVTVFAGSPPHD